MISISDTASRVLPTLASSQRVNRIALPLTVIAGAAARLPGLDGQMFLHRDDSAIVYWAIELVRTGLFDWTLARPGYVGVLALLAAVTGKLGYGPLLSVFAGLLTIIVTYAWARRWAGWETAALSAAIVAASQLHNFYSRVQQPAALVTLYLALASLWYWDSRQSPLARGSLWRLAGVGAILATALTHHPSVIVFPPLFLAFELELAVRQRSGLRYGRRWLALVIPFLLLCLLMEGVTAARQVPSGSSFSFLAQLQSAYSYQTGPNYHLASQDDIVYYLVSLLLVEGLGGTVLVLSGLLWGCWRFVRQPSSGLAFLLTLTLGLLGLWSVSGVLGSADHLRVILPGLPAAAILTAQALRAATQRALARHRVQVPAATIGLVAMICAVGVWNSRPLFSADTGYLPIARELTARTEPLWVVSGKDRTWNVAIEQARVDGAGNPRDAGQAVRSQVTWPLAQPVKGISSVDELVLARGGTPCLVILESLSDVLDPDMAGTPDLALVVQRRREEFASLAGEPPISAASASWLEMPIVRLEGTDTPVPTIARFLKHGVGLPPGGSEVVVFELRGGDVPGCVPRS